jgi:hypothetical protein
MQRTVHKLMYTLERNPASDLQRCLVRSEVLTVKIMKNSLFWDIKSQFLPQRRYITSPLENQSVNAM